MNTELKCQIIEEYVRYSMERQINQDFISYNDLGIPLAVCVNAEIATINGEGIDIINETYELLCDKLEVDKNKSYANFEEMIEDSPVEQLDPVEDDD